MFIVEGKPREKAGSVKIIKRTSRGALATANDFREGGLPFVTIHCEDRTYSAEEFSLTFGSK